MRRRDDAMPLDPAVAVAGLLTRLGIFALIVLVPMLAMISRRAVAIFVPIATVLLILAAALDGRLGLTLKRSLGALLVPQTLAALLLLAYAGVSILWSPRPADGIDRLTSILSTLALMLATIAALPARSRASDANLVPIGAALAAVVLCLGFLPHSPVAMLIGPDMPIEAQRASMLLALVLWPAMTAMAMRERVWPAVTLGVVMLTALWFVHDLVVIAAFLLAGIAFLLAMWRPIAAIRVFGVLLVGTLILAPLIGWLMAQYGGFLMPGEGDRLVEAWRDVTYALPSHLTLGFGFEASQSLQRTVSNVPLGSPRNVALQIWLELGIVGVLLSALVMGLALRAVERASDVVRPPALAVLVAAWTMMFTGLATWQIWWVTALGLAAILIAFIGRSAPRSRG